MCELKTNLHMPAYYLHDNGDKDSCIILDVDGKERAWIKWDKDGFINLMPIDRLEVLTNDQPESI
jgi:hypothetical protein